MNARASARRFHSCQTQRISSPAGITRRGKKPGAPKRILSSPQALTFLDLRRAFAGFFSLEALIWTHRDDHLELLHVRFFGRRAGEAMQGQSGVGRIDRKSVV